MALTKQFISQSCQTTILLISLGIWGCGSHNQPNSDSGFNKNNQQQHLLAEYQSLWQDLHRAEGKTREQYAQKLLDFRTAYERPATVCFLSFLKAH